MAVVGCHHRLALLLARTLGGPRVVTLGAAMLPNGLGSELSAELMMLLVVLWRMIGSLSR